MVEARLTRGPLPRAWTLATVAAVGLASVGCTMCPDPFDYSGPVPNGSSPQNDFRARSTGILPLGAAPKPWPLIVKNDGAQADGPQENEPTPTLADEADAEALQQTVAVVGESAEEAGVDGQPEVVPESAGSAPDALEPVPVAADQIDAPLTVEEEAAAEQTVAEEGAPVEEPQAVPQPPVAPVTPPNQASETPGWRARRR
jgi:hypothetical protein